MPRKADKYLPVYARFRSGGCTQLRFKNQYTTLSAGEVRDLLKLHFVDIRRENPAGIVLKIRWSPVRLGADLLGVVMESSSYE